MINIKVLEIRIIKIDTLTQVPIQFSLSLVSSNGVTGESKAQAFITTNYYISFVGLIT